MNFPSTTLRQRPPARAARALSFLVFTLGMVPVVRADAPPPELYTISPGSMSVHEGSPLSMVYEFYNPFPYTVSVDVAPIPTTDFYGPLGAAGGEVAELTSFSGYNASIGPGQYGQFTLPFTTTGIDEGNSASWQFSMPQVSYTCSSTYGAFSGMPFGTPTLTIYQTPEPSTLCLLGAAAVCVTAYVWRKPGPSETRKSEKRARLRNAA